MTGRGAGYCAGFGQPGFANPIPGRRWFGFGGEGLMDTTMLTDRWFPTRDTATHTTVEEPAMLEEQAKILERELETSGIDLKS